MVYDSKLINYAGKCYSILVVAPQSRNDWRRLIPEWAEMLPDSCVCNDAHLDYPIHSIFHPNIEKYVDFIIHQVVLIYDVLRDQDECSLVVFMLRHQVVEVEVLDISH